MKNDGGRAFPVPENMGSYGAPHQINEQGMSLRDWFAGQALPAIIQVFDAHAPDAATHENFAREAYRIADAMIAARSKE